LGKGGKFGFTTWSPPGETSALSVIRNAVKDLVPAEALLPAPDIYQLGELRVVTELLDEAGLATRKVETLDSKWRFASAGQFWEHMTHGNPLERMLARLPAETVDAIREESLRRVRPSAAADGSLALDCEALIVVAQKGMT
jgi:hypothetical protein